MIISLCFIWFTSVWLQCTNCERRWYALTCFDLFDIVYFQSIFVRPFVNDIYSTCEIQKVNRINSAKVDCHLSEVTLQVWILNKKPRNHWLKATYRTNIQQKMNYQGLKTLVQIYHQWLGFHRRRYEGNMEYRLGEVLRHLVFGAIRKHRHHGAEM